MDKTATEKLLRAAARLFRKRGIAGASIRAIAKEAGMLPGSVTYRYATKDALAIAMMEQGVERAMQEVLAVIENSRDPVERLRLALRAHLGLLLSGEDAVWVLLYEWERFLEDTRTSMVRLRDRYDAIWDGLIYEAAGSGQLVAGLDLRLVRLFVFGAANSVAQWYRADGPRTPEQIADAFSAFIGLGVLDVTRRPDDLRTALDRFGALDPRRTERESSGGQERLNEY